MGVEGDKQLNLKKIVNEENHEANHRSSLSLDLRVTDLLKSNFCHSFNTCLCKCSKNVIHYMRRKNRLGTIFFRHGRLYSSAGSPKL